MDITQLLAFSVKNKASDLHLSAGLPPMIRVHGDVRRINVEALDHKAVHAMVYDIMNDTQRKNYEEFLEVDFSFEIDGLARFRVNAFNHNRGAGAVLRTIPSKILTLEQLNAPKIFGDLAMKPRGMVLVTGPTGSGKSTTLAAMVNYLNENEYGHILTVEDPIEFVHESKKCLINQREVVKGQLVNMRDGGFISAHDFHIASLIAGVVCGGDVDNGTLVTEEYLMALERKAFCSLLEHPKTQERIMGMMSTGKPVRN